MQNHSRRPSQDLQGALLRKQSAMELGETLRALYKRLEVDSLGRRDIFAIGEGGVRTRS